MLLRGEGILQYPSNLLCLPVDIALDSARMTAIQYFVTFSRVPNGRYLRMADLGQCGAGRWRNYHGGLVSPTRPMGSFHRW